MPSTSIGAWKLCEPKPIETIYKGGANPCLTVIYRVTNDGPAAVLVDGQLFLDPGTSVDTSTSGAGSAITVALAGRPKCPPGATGDDQRAAGTYELLCCECCCEPQSGAAEQAPAGAPPIVTLTAGSTTLINAATGAAEKFVNLQWTVTGGVGTVTVTIDLDPPFPNLQNPIWRQMGRQGSCQFPNSTTGVWAPQFLSGFPRLYSFTAIATDSSAPPLSSSAQASTTV